MQKHGTSQPATRLARLISLVLHPFVVIPLAIILVLYLNNGDLLAAIWWAGLCGLFFITPVLIFLMYKVAKKQVTDADVSVREQRQGMFIFAAICMLVCFGLLRALEAPSLLMDMFVGGLIALLVLTLTTRFLTKASLHAGTLAGITVVAAFYSWPWAMVLAGITLLVAWSRLVLKRHTLVELASGMGIEGMIFLLMMLTQQ